MNEDRGQGGGGGGNQGGGGHGPDSVTQAPGPTPENPWSPGQALDHAADAAHNVTNPSMITGLTTNFGKSWSDNMTQFSQADSPAKAIRAVSTLLSNINAAISLPGDLLNAGFAQLTNPIAALFPSLPAAFLGSPYLGMPHAHSHPPSLIPPAPPVPLPSIGVVTLGTSVKVLISNMPAARCGDIGLAPTCGGLQPFFSIKTGSSNVFIGGNRAARMLDICEACASASRDDAANASTLNKVAAGAMTAIEVAGKVGAGMGVLADAAEAASEDDAAMAAAKALAAAMGAAQIAADAAAKAITASMGTDPGIPPGTKGAVMMGNPTVLIGGFPMINIPNPINYLLEKLKNYRPRQPSAPDSSASPPANTSCPH
jgi:uncharacterized Zn-binding protein involved in type VI secretion